MLGWEFPPYFAGGVGTVCHELTRGLARNGVHVTYIMPHGPDDAASKHVRLLVADRAMQRLGVTTLRVKSLLTPYTSANEYEARYAQALRLNPMDAHPSTIYGKDLLEEMYRFAAAVLEIARDEEFDIIHAHDWTTIPAALALKRASGKPLVVHVHITEFDKTGGEHADPEVYRIERDGFQAADRVIAISEMVQRRLVRQYGVDPARIRVVYNTVEYGEGPSGPRERMTDGERVVLFLGRVTLQKGPDYFIEAAAKVAHVVPNARFIIAGTGDMLPRIVERAVALGIGHRVTFTGFVGREDGDRLYRMADVFVMPSVSEPFGLVPLEAMKQGTPVIVSRQSGVSEVLRNALKVDFWDVDELANKIIAALTYNDLHAALREHGEGEIRNATWDIPATQCVRVYREALGT